MNERHARLRQQRRPEVVDGQSARETRAAFVRRRQIGFGVRNRALGQYAGRACARRTSHRCGQGARRGARARENDSRPRRLARNRETNTQKQARDCHETVSRPASHGRSVRPYGQGGYTLNWLSQCKSCCSKTRPPELAATGYTRADVRLVFAGRSRAAE